MTTRILPAAVTVWVGLAGAARADDPVTNSKFKKADVDAMVDKGLEWLKRNQASDGHWEAQGGQYPTTMTAWAGMAMLMEGSTLREGKYSDNLLKCTNWLMSRSQPNGLIGNPNNPTEASRYMYGHGFGLLFLACIYGEEDDKDRRKKLEGILTRAVDFAGKSQTNRGGWGYVSALEGGNFDEGSVTITQLQGIRAAKNAGIKVPKQIIDMSVKYLHDCTTDAGGIIYSLGQGRAAIGGEREPLTAAAVACSFSAGQYNDEYAKKWIKFCKQRIPFGRGRLAHDEYQNYYFSQAVFVLGDDRYVEMFPNEPKKDALLWSAFRETMFDYLKGNQASDGSWNGGYIGPVMATSVALTILQLEKGILPIYHR
jgi:hypothetical protein